ncbi:MAG: DUF5777 family beta-barrel protein [Bacteroidota bacterium]
MRKINIKKLSIVAVMAIPVVLFAQEQSSPEPVKNAFEHSTLINSNTTETHGNHSLDVAIQHRFGAMDKFDDLYGVYAPSNIRLYIGYGITKDISVGIGSCKANNNFDFSWRYKILQQKTSGMPVSVTYVGNVARKFVKDEKMLNMKNEFNQLNKITYYNELMVSRKFNSHLSLQVGAYCAYYNLLDSASFSGQHIFFGASAVGRYKFSPQSSILVEYNLPLADNKDMPKATKPMPNLGIGIEVSTGNHQFQIFVCNASGILSQDARVYNNSDLTNLSIPAWLIGFNITRQWGFSK